MSQKKKEKKKQAKKGRTKKSLGADRERVKAKQTPESLGDDPEAQAELARKLRKQGLLGPWVTFVMCGDEGKEKCASAREMRSTWKALKQGIKHRRKDDDKRAAAVRTRCFGVCSQGPLIGVQPQGCWYGKCSAEQVERLLAHHLDGAARPELPRADPQPPEDEPDRTESS